ncbi:MAG: inositol monophosphatase family protein [Alphaproteobacteria bacterium]
MTAILGAAMPVDIDAVTRILEEAAVEEVLPRFQSLQSHEVREKEYGELVTVADVKAEEHISRRLRDLRPDAFLVGEEAVAADPSILARITEEPMVWVIDPIDGTSNFASGNPVFAIMVGLVEQGRTVAAWIHDPVAGTTATAEIGSGAWQGTSRLIAAAAAPIKDMRGTLHASTFAVPEMARQIQTRRSRVNAVKSLRCAGHEYLRLASGQIHFSLFTRLMPWDHVPGALIYREAGGMARTLDGADYGARSYQASGLLLAPDATAWQALHDVLLSAESN